MPAARNNPGGASSPPSATKSRDGGHRGRRLRSGSAPHGPPDVGLLAREAVISFLNDASRATAEREAVRVGIALAEAEATVTAEADIVAGEADGIPAPAPEPEAMAREAMAREAMAREAISVPNLGTAGSEAWRAAAISVAALDRIEAAVAKVEEDIAVANRAYAELQAGAGAAAEAAVNAAQTAMRQVRISLRQVRQNVVISVVLVIIVIIVLQVATSPVH
jgi:hypothetical protein